MPDKLPRQKYAHTESGQCGGADKIAASAVEIPSKGHRLSFRLLRDD
ncbi:hypothetical protein RSSM_00867 [Rhodopirellula sallentina SM41]|uniref:Uncharacterized protein n=1 Tax=Rhodopirellula sallentina SM41 TaxID=1263870 RepID=M5UIK3_9BACT|nr:hypothetical protein RSSM_00867 [Rhodopirellula sallentina SM41]